MKHIKKITLGGAAAFLLIATLSLATTSCKVPGTSKNAAVISFVSYLNTSTRSGIENLFVSGTSYMPSTFNSGPWAVAEQVFSMSNYSESGSTATCYITNSTGTFTVNFTFTEVLEGSLFSTSNWKITAISISGYH